MKLKFVDRFKKVILTIIGFYIIKEFFKRYYINKGKSLQKTKQIRESNKKSLEIKKYARETDEIIDSVPDDKLYEFL